MSDFLQLNNKTIVVFGVANRKSIAYHVGKSLEESGANVIYVVRSKQRKDELSAKLLSDRRSLTTGCRRRSAEDR